MIQEICEIDILLTNNTDRVITLTLLTRYNLWVDIQLISTFSSL